jgi:uncharacterized protein DUF4406
LTVPRTPATVLDMVTPHDLRLQGGEVIYLAGPISENPLFNHMDSARIARLLRNKGYSVIDAAAIEHMGFTGEAPDYGWHDYMNDDVRFLMEATAICLRPQWPYSRGALAELTIAAAIGLDIYFWLEDIQGMILMGERD